MFAFGDHSSNTKLTLGKTLKLSDGDISRIKLKTVDNAQGDEADFVIYDMATTYTTAFVEAEFRNTLGLRRSRASLVVISNRSKFIGHEQKQISISRDEDTHGISTQFISLYVLPA